MCFSPTRARLIACCLALGLAGCLRIGLGGRVDADADADVEGGADADVEGDAGADGDTDGDADGDAGDADADGDGELDGDHDRDGGVEESVFEAVPLPAGGPMDRVAFARDASSTYYAKARSGRLFRSDDRGGHWSECSLPAPGGALTVAPEEPATLLVSTASDVLISRDGCATWEDTELGMSARTLHMLSSTEAFAGVGDGLFRLEADGWERISTPLDGHPISSIVVADDGQRVYIGSATSGAARSLDGGREWQDVTAGLPSPQIFDLAMDQSDGRRVLVQTLGGLAISTTSGDDWPTIYTWGRGPVAVDPAEPTWVVAWGWDYLRAGRDGAMEAVGDRRSSNMDHAWVDDLVFDPEIPGRLVSATGRGLFVASDRTYDWTESHLGLSSWMVTAISRDPRSSRLYLATPGGVLRSDDGGGTWLVSGVQYMTSARGSSTTSHVLAGDAEDQVLACGRHIMQSFDAGGSFDELAHVGGLDDAYRASVVRIRGERLVFGTGGRLGVSTDSGETFLVRQVAGDTRAVADLLLLDEVAAGGILVATSSGVYWTSDNGSSYEARHGGLVGLDAHALERLPDGTTLVGTDDGLFASTDLGVSWAATPVTGSPVLDILSVDGLLLVVAESGVFVSTDGAVSWTRLPGLDEGERPRCLGDPGDGTFLVGTLAGNGLYRAPLPGGE